MVISKKNGSPLTKEQIIKIKYSLEPYQNRVVEEDSYRILCIRSPSALPDIVNDLENVVERLDEENTENISHAILIGDEEVVGIDLGAIGAVMSKRKEHDEEIIKELQDKLPRDFGTILFHSEMDPSSIYRLGIRVPMSLEELEEKGHSAVLGGLDIPQEGEVVYLIGDDEATRLTGEDFYSRLAKLPRDDISEIVDDELPKREGMPLSMDDEMPKFEREPLSRSLFDEDLEPPSEKVSLTEEIALEPPHRSISLDPSVLDSADEPEPPLKSTTADSSLLDSAAERIHKSLSLSLEESLARIRSSLDSLVLEPLSSRRERPRTSRERVVEKRDVELEMDMEPRDEVLEEIEPKKEVTPRLDDIKPRYSSDDVYGKIKNALVKNGFDIAEETLIDGVDIVAQFPDSNEELLVRHLKDCTIKDAFAINRITERRSGSWGLLIAESIEKDVEIFAIGKRFKVFPTNIFLGLLQLRDIIRE